MCIDLFPSFFCQLDTMIWDHLVDVAILVSFTLRMPNHNDHLQDYKALVIVPTHRPCISLNTHSWFAHLGEFLMCMIELVSDGELYGCISDVYERISHRWRAVWLAFV